MFDCVCVRERGCVFVVDLEVVSPEKHCWGHGAKLERRRGEGRGGESTTRLDVFGKCETAR